MLLCEIINIWKTYVYAFIYIYIYITCIFTYTPRLTQYFRSSRSGTSLILHMTELSVYIYIYIYTYIYIWYIYIYMVNYSCNLYTKGVTWSATTWPPHHLRYRLAVFFRHLRHITLSLPERKIRGSFKKCYYLILLRFKNYLSFKLRDLESRMPKGVCVCVIFICVYLCLYTHTHTNTNTHKYTHTHTQCKMCGLHLNSVVCTYTVW
jgi:hypothetical protein